MYNISSNFGTCVFHLIKYFSISISIKISVNLVEYKFLSSVPFNLSEQCLENLLQHALPYMAVVNNSKHFQMPSAHKCCEFAFVWTLFLCSWFIHVFECEWKNFQLPCFDLSHSVISPNCTDWSIKFICKHVAKWRLNKCCCHIGVAFISLRSMYSHLMCYQHSGYCCAQFVTSLLLLWLLVLLLWSKLQLVRALISLCNNIHMLHVYHIVWPLKFNWFFYNTFNVSQRKNLTNNVNRWRGRRSDLFINGWKSEIAVSQHICGIYIHIY